MRSIWKSVSRTTVSRHPARLPFRAAAEPLPELALRRPHPSGGLVVEDAYELEEGELPRQPVDHVAEALAFPFEGLQPGVRALREVDRLRRHRVYVCVYGT